MKFRSTKDIHLFLAEVGRMDLMESIEDGANWVPDQELVERYLTGRRSIIPKLKDFRKSQNTKFQWRERRPEMMRGISMFHKSTEGKQFHRRLGRYLSNRFLGGGKKRGVLGYDEKYEALKALSSLRTHLYIEKHYYQPLDEQVEFEAFMDEIVPATIREELRVYNDDPAVTPEEDLDILCRSIAIRDLLTECCVDLGRVYQEDDKVRFLALEASEKNSSYPDLIKKLYS